MSNMSLHINKIFIRHFRAVYGKMRLLHCTQTVITMCHSVYNTFSCAVIFMMGHKTLYSQCYDKCVSSFDLSHTLEHTFLSAHEKLQYNDMSHYVCYHNNY